MRNLIKHHSLQTLKAKAFLMLVKHIWNRAPCELLHAFTFGHFMEQIIARHLDSHIFRRTHKHASSVSTRGTNQRRTSVSCNLSEPTRDVHVSCVNHTYTHWQPRYVRPPQVTLHKVINDIPNSIKGGGVAPVCLKGTPFVLGSWWAAHHSSSSFECRRCHVSPYSGQGRCHVSCDDWG